MNIWSEVAVHFLVHFGLLGVVALLFFLAFKRLTPKGPC